MHERRELLALLTRDFQRAKAANPSYSLRAYAKRLRISPAALSGYLGGRLPLASKSGERILSALAVEPEKRLRILAGLKRRDSAGAFVQVDMAQYRLISSWYAFAIVSLAETEGFLGTSDFIAERLSISRGKAAQSVRALLSLGLLEKTPDGRVVSTGKSFKTSSDIPNRYLQKSHRGNLDLMRVSLAMDSVEERDFSAMTMAIDPAKLPEAKRRIAAFRRRLSSFLESGKKTEVYRVWIGLIPLSKARDTGPVSRNRERKIPKHKRSAK